MQSYLFALPITAAIAFYLGKRYAGYRHQPHPEKNDGTHLTNPAKETNPGENTDKPSEQSTLSAISAENETVFQQIIEAAPIGICIIRERRFAFINDAYMRMFGYDRQEEIIGRFVEDLYSEEEREKQRGYARDRTAGKPVPTVYETVGLRKNGETFQVSAWVSRIRFQNQFSSLGFVIDRSVENEMRRQLDHANRLEAVGTLAGGIAHDFNNILTAIIGYTELALMRSKDNPQICNDLEQSLKAGKRAKDLVQQILAFSRKQDQPARQVKLADVVDEVLRLVRATIPTSIAMELHLNSKASILADPIRIHQLLMNLCTNAEHAMRKTGGRLHIEVSDYTAPQGVEKSYPGFAPGKYIVLRIADTGSGIHPSIREKIFEPFFTTKATGEGTGLGLAQVHSIAKSHNAYLHVGDNNPCGTVFSIFFPVVENMEDDTTEEHITPGSNTARLLLVDDEPMVLDVTGRILTELGYHVTGCAEAPEALHRFQENPDSFDLIITDMTMPEMTGTTLATHLQIIRPDIPIIICSGYSLAMNETSELKQIHLAAVLDKPVGKDILARTVSGLLGSRQRLVEHQ